MCYQSRCQSPRSRRPADKGNADSGDEIDALQEITSLSNKSNLGQSDLSEMQCISYSVCRHETCADLCLKRK